MPPQDFFIKHARRLSFSALLYTLCTQQTLKGLKHETIRIVKDQASHMVFHRSLNGILPSSMPGKITHSR